MKNPQKMDRQVSNQDLEAVIHNISIKQNAKPPL